VPGHLDEGNIDVANYYAKVKGIALTGQHWEIVNYVREYYKRCHIAPLLKILLMEIGNKFGKQRGNTRRLYEFFPGDRPGRPARSPIFPADRLLVV
jgi:TusE/DsrC/DsvC family sulfur relay protein